MEHDIEPSHDEDPQANSDSARRGGNRLGQMQVLVAAGFLGVLTAVVALMVWTSIQNRGQLPPLTLDAFEQAKQRWEAQAPSDYNITIEVEGRQAAIYHVEIRAGEVVVSTRNSLPLKQRRTRGTWSVPGMFTTMQADVDNAELHRLGTAAEGVPQVQLHALFDPKFGYPQRYHRTELRKFGNNDAVFWEVTQFEVVSGEVLAQPAESSK